MKHQEHIVAVFADKFNKVAEENPQPGNIYDCTLFEGPIENKDIIVAQRANLENDDSFRQLIPYIALRNKNGEFLTYTRTKKGNESRLHKKISVGFGGHMDATDVVFNEDSVVNVMETIKNCVARETIEELGPEAYSMIKSNIDNLKISKLIIDDKTEVEKVHMALLLIVDSSDSFPVTSPDDSVNMLGFLSVDEIREIDGNIEPWSEIVISQ